MIQKIQKGIVPGEAMMRRKDGQVQVPHIVGGYAGVLRRVRGVLSKSLFESLISIGCRGRHNEVSARYPCPLALNKHQAGIVRVRIALEPKIGTANFA